MNNNVFCDETEIRTACNKMVNYVDYIDRQLEKTSATLKYLRKEGMIDNKICSALLLLGKRITEDIRHSTETAMDRLPNIVSSEVRDIEKADDFIYPASFLDAVTSILREFQ